MTARFAAAGNAFVAEGADLGRHAFTFGVGFDAAIGDATVFSLNYQGEVKENFTSHGGMANIRYNF